jgi:hypothetical protein
MKRMCSAGLVVAALVPIAAGCGGGAGGVATNETESLAVENVRKVPGWVNRNHLPAPSLPGARLFAQIGCLNCHTYLGTGGGYKGAPDLSAEGVKHRGIAWQIWHLRCPACVKAGSPMPSFRALGVRRLREIAIFLEASRGGK